MPSLAKAISSLVAVAVAAVQHNPGRVFLVVLAVTAAGYWTGVLTPLDWWGNREIPR